MCTLTWLLDRRRSAAAICTTSAVAASSQNAWIEMRGMGRARCNRAGSSPKSLPVGTRSPAAGRLSSATEWAALLILTPRLIGGLRGRALVGAARGAGGRSLAIFVEHDAAAFRVGGIHCARPDQISGVGD